MTACSETRENEATEQSTSELSSTDNVHRAIAYGRQLVGTPYGWWTGGGIPAGEPMFARNAPAPPTSSVASVNCTGLTNLMLRSVGKPVPVSVVVADAGSQPSPAPAAPAASAAATASGDDVKAEALANSTVQAVLEIFPVEKTTVEER